MEQVYLKPGRAGLVVRDPDSGKPLAAEGERKPLSLFWRRRMKQGDAVKAAKPRKSS